MEKPYKNLSVERQDRARKCRWSSVRSVAYIANDPITSRPNKYAHSDAKCGGQMRCKLETLTIIFHKRRFRFLKNSDLAELWQSFHARVVSGVLSRRELSPEEPTEKAAIMLFTFIQSVLKQYWSRPQTYSVYSIMEELSSDVPW
jgi:hypothetical protein